MPEALALAILPAMVGFAVGRWWLLLIAALVTTTSLGQLVGHGTSGPLFVMLLTPLAGCAAGVALRRAVRPPRDLA